MDDNFVGLDEDDLEELRREDRRQELLDKPINRFTVDSDVDFYGEGDYTYDMDEEFDDDQEDS